jgi:SAM-dependent methyltransferase
LTALLHRYRTEGNTPVRQALSIGLGLYIGASPFIGFHLGLILLFGWLLGLNRLKAYLASHISNPLFAPILYAVEIQIGAWIRTGHMYSTVSLHQLQFGPLALDVLIGSVVVGGVLAVTGTIVTYALMSEHGRDPQIAHLVDAAAERYLTIGLSTWEFAHAKLEMDQVYLDVLRDGVLPDAGVLYDLGCGQGLMLSLLGAARDRYPSGEWPAGWPAPPSALELRGIELRPRVARRTRELLQDLATIEALDLSKASLPRCEAVLLVDVLHLMAADAQDRLLEHVARALTPGGVLVLREADASGGWRFRMVRLGNRLTALVHGRFGSHFSFRTAGAWTAKLKSLGFEVARLTPNRGGPFANFVVYARVGNAARSQSGS